MKKIHLKLAVFAAVLFAFVGTVFAEGKRYVSLAPSTTEILFALGLDKEIVGVSQFCDYPPAAGDKEKVGAFSQPDIEKIVSLNPDIVFCTGLEQAPVAHKLEELGWEVVMSDPGGFDELFEDIREIGELVGREAEASALAGIMEKKVAQVAAKSRGVPEDRKPKVLVEFWHNPLMTAGEGSFMDELIRLAGGVNIAGDIGRPYGNLSSEQVIERKPDVIFLTYMNGGDSVDAVKKTLGWGAVPAVAKGRIFADFDPDLILVPGPRLAEGLAEMHKRLYPREAH